MHGAEAGCAVVSALAAQPGDYTIGWMKEMTTIRLYERPTRCEWCDGLDFRTTDAVTTWNLGRGDRIPLEERNGGYVEGVIDHVDPEIHTDRTGRFKLAVIWTQD